VDGRELRQPLELRPDPRLKLAQADFVREFALARQVEAARARAAAALAEMKARHESLVSEEAKPSPDHHARLAALDAELQAMAPVAPDGPRAGPTPPPQTTTALTDISARLDALAQAVDGADGAPTADAQSGYAQASQALDAALARWTSLRGRINVLMYRPKA
jgi:hypothetical protein